MSEREYLGREMALHILKEAGLRRTEARVLILELMGESETPLEARQIQDLAAAKGMSEGLWLSTVYRNLELFADKGLVQEVKPPESESIFYRLEVHGHNHYAICENCHMEIPLDLCPFEEIERQLQAADFVPTHHRLEVFGLCSACRRRLNR